MRTAIGASALAHGTLALMILATRPNALVQPPEMEGRLEVIFGKNADLDGAPVVADAPPGAAVASAPVASPATEVGDAPASPATVAAPAQASAAAAAVRLGEGKIGFDVPHPDDGLVQARADPGNRPPRYPEAAVARHEHGTTVLGIHIDERGRTTRSDLLRSSGFADLDIAAREAVARWRFIPQVRDGRAAPSYREQAFDFVL